MTREAGSHRLVGMMNSVDEAEYRKLIGQLSIDELAILRTLEVEDLRRLRSRLHNMYGHRSGVRGRIDNDIEVRRSARKRELIEERLEALLRIRRDRRM